MSAPSIADIAAFTRASLNRRPVSTGLRPLVDGSYFLTHGRGPHYTNVYSTLHMVYAETVSIATKDLY